MGVLALSFIAPAGASADPVASTPTAPATTSTTTSAVAVSGTSTALGSTSDAALVAARQQLAALQERASRIDSDYVRAQVRLDAVDAAIAATRKSLASARQQVAELQPQVASLTLGQVQAGLPVPAQLLSERLLAASTRLTAAQQATASASASLTRQQAEHDRLVRLHASQRALAAVFDQRIASQQAVVDQLSSQDAEALQEQNVLAQRIAQAQSATTAPTSATTAPVTQPTATTTVTVTLPATAASASSRVATAISYAMAQRGKAYVMGGTGPTSFDCSGLMLRAWQAAGVELPRTSQEQIKVGASVNVSDLQPGDLVFYYPGVTHVGMYIGNGLIVNAENSRVGIVVTRVDSMPIVGARRIA